MQIDEKLVDHLANLSKLKFEGEAKETIIQDLNQILTFISQLDEVDTQNVEPLVFVSGSQNVMREDKVFETIEKKEALKNAASKDSDYFKIPTVLKK